MLKLTYYPNGKIMFKDIFVPLKTSVSYTKKQYIPLKHLFYIQKPIYHLYLSVHYNDLGKISKYIKHKYPNGYYEYLELHDNGYLKDKLYKSSPYCKYIERNNGKNYYLTVHRYNLINNKFIKRSSEYIKNGNIIHEKFYKNGKLIIDKIYKNGKKIKMYKSKKDQPKIKDRK